jgi:hypothetical protein
MSVNPDDLAAARELLKKQRLVQPAAVPAPAAGAAPLPGLTNASSGKPAPQVRTYMKPLSLIELKLIHSLIDKSLSECTGLHEDPRKLISSYILASYAMRNLQIMPVLVLRGPYGTGKSQAEDVILNFACKPKRMTMDGATLPTVREAMADTYEATLILEEADKATNDRDHHVERMLSNRYSRATASASLRVQELVEAKDKRGRVTESGLKHRTEVEKTFGGTVLHKRHLFFDQGLESRSITVLFRFNSNRDAESYRKFSPDDPWNKEGRELLQGREIDSLPTVRPPSKVAPRIFDTYAPLYRVAFLLDDNRLLEVLLRMMRADTAKMVRGQGEEPLLMVLRAIVQKVFNPAFPASEDSPVANYSSLRIQDLTRILREDSDCITSYQVAGYARELGFRVKTAHGQVKLFPTAIAIVKAADQCNYFEDEGVNAIRKQVADNPDSVCCLLDENREEN